MEYSLILASLVIVFGAMIQSVSGVGGGFIMVPLLAMIDMRFLPGPFLFATLALSTLMAWRERGDLDFAGVGWLCAAMVPGAVLGAWLLSRVPADSLGIVFSVAILLAVAISLAGVHLPLNRVTASVSGFVAGAMGATSAIGAPVIAVLYQRESGPRIRSTLAFIYTVATVLIILALAAFGRFTATDMQTGLWLVRHLSLVTWCRARLHCTLIMARPVILCWLFLPLPPSCCW